MLSARELLELRQLDAPVLSLYLELGGAQEPMRALAALASDARARPELAGRGAEIERLCDEARRRAPCSPPGRRGLALFSCPAGLLTGSLLPQPVKTGLRAGRRPWLEPLESIVEAYQRYAVLLLDAGSSRFYEVFLDQIEELKPEPPPPPLTQDPAQRRLASIARQLTAVVRARAIERVILSAPPELEAALIGHLPSAAQDNLIVDSRLSPGMEPSELLKGVALGQSQSRAVRESVLVHRLLDGMRAGGGAVVGLAETLGALRRGEIRLLLVREGLVRMGRRCPHCLALSLSGKKCHYCWLETEPVLDLIAELVEQALDQGCELLRVAHDRGLDAHGGLGAELRFKSVGEPSAAPAPAARK